MYLVMHDKGYANMLHHMEQDVLLSWFVGSWCHIINRDVLHYCALYAVCTYAQLSSVSITVEL